MSSPWTIVKWIAMGTLVGRMAQAIAIRRDPPFPQDAGPLPNVEAVSGMVSQSNTNVAMVSSPVFVMA